MVLKRVGGKAKLANWIVKNLPSYNNFIDVFGGSGAVLAKAMSTDRGKHRFVFNDSDGAICNFFKVLIDYGEKLALMTDMTPYSRVMFDESFDLLNSSKYKELSDLRKALVFLIVNRQCFGAKMTKPWSITRDGEINYKTWNKLPALILETQRKWKNVFLEQLDYRELITKWDCEGTTLYLDPPYEGVEQEYYKVNEEDGFDHKAMFNALSDVKSSFVVSYYGGETEAKDPELISQYRTELGCRVERMKVAKHLSAADKKEFATEVLLIKGESPQRLVELY